LNQTAPRFMGFHSVISNKPRLHTKKAYSYNKNQESWCYDTNVWVCLFEFKR